jgi:hypothetical protein
VYIHNISIDHMDWMDIFSGDVISPSWLILMLISLT